MSGYHWLESLWRGEEAIASLEYALLLALISAALLAAAAGLGDQVLHEYTEAADTLSGA